MEADVKAKVSVQWGRWSGNFNCS